MLPAPETIHHDAYQDGVDLCSLSVRLRPSDFRYWCFKSRLLLRGQRLHHRTDLGRSLEILGHVHQRIGARKESLCCLAGSSLQTCRHPGFAYGGAPSDSVPHRFRYRKCILCRFAPRRCVARVFLRRRRPFCLLADSWRDSLLDSRYTVQSLYSLSVAVYADQHTNCPTAAPTALALDRGRPFVRLRTLHLRSARYFNRPLPAIENIDSDLSVPKTLVCCFRGTCVSPINIWTLFFPEDQYLHRPRSQSVRGIVG